MMLGFLAVYLLCLSAPVGQAQSPNGFFVDNVTADGALFLPTDIAVTSTGRMYVAHKMGEVRIVEPDGRVLPVPFLDLSADIRGLGDRGLLGIALHPGFPGEPYVYVYYSRVDSTTTDRDVPFTYGRLERWTASAPGFSVADPESRVILLGDDYSNAAVGCGTTHAGATVAFGPDGSLLLSTGDAASSLEPDGGGGTPDCFVPGRADPANDVGGFRSQRLESLNGKILRLDPATGLGLPDNPFWTGDASDPASRVWSLGLRNPFRMAVHPDVSTLRVAVGDVGWFTTEELNIAAGGENFGWPCFEGTTPSYWYGGAAPPGYACDFSTSNPYVAPSAEWSHSDPALSIPAGLTARSITGGTFYTGDAFPEAYRGALFLADFASEWLMAIDFDGAVPRSAERVLEGVGAIVDLEVSPDGESILLLDILGGRVLRLLHSGASDLRPVARVALSPDRGVAPLAVTFSSENSFDPAGGSLAAEWAFGDGATSSGAVVEHVYADTGVYTATLTLTSQAGVVSQTTWRIVVGENMPVLRIDPVAENTVEAGTVVPLTAQASDAGDDDGSLPIRWEARLVHNEHEHPAVYTAEGPRAMLPALAHASNEELSYYTVTARTEDSEGLRASQTIALPVIPPETVVATVKPLWEGERTVTFGRELSVRSVLVPDTTLDAAAVGVELRHDGAWAPPQFAQTVRVQGGTRVLFVEQEADAVRVADGPALPEVRVRIGAPGPLPLGLDAVVLGDADARASSAQTTDGGLALGAATGDVFAYTSLDEAVMFEARVESVIGGGRAGVAVRSGLGVGSDALVLAQSADGTVTLEQGAGVARVDTLGHFPGPVRLGLSATEAVVWAEGSPVPTLVVSTGRESADGAQFAGAYLSSPGSLAWFSSVRTTVRPPASPVVAFDIGALAPNPTAGDLRVGIDASAEGRYIVELFDVLGRRLLVESRDMVAAGRLSVKLDLDAFGTGVFTVRVTETSSGRAATGRVTHVR